MIFEMGKRVISSLLIGFLLVFSFLISFPGKTRSASMTIKILPILMDFTDQPHQRTAQEMYDYFFSNKEGDRSLRNYYLEVTNDSVDFIPGSYGVGDWLIMPLKKKEYAQRGDRTLLMRNVFEKLKEKNVNLKEYDNNGDGYIDHTIFIQAGDPRYYSGSFFWLHKSWARGNIGYDGVYVDEYIMTAEIFYADKMAPLQGICHEFYHNLGGWDLYSYTGSGIAVGPWDIMADNFNNFGLSGFSRSQLGWLSPRKITKSGTYEIDALCSNGRNRLYRIDIPGTKEYFLLENRYLVGIDSWWQGVPDQGLVIYHIDGAITPRHRFNDGPPTFPHFAVWVEDAGNVKGKVDAAYCEEDSQTEFTPFTVPDSFDYAKKCRPTIFITNVSKSGEKMTFKAEFKYLEPKLKMEPEELDFGKIEKGMRKEKKIKIINEGTSTLHVKLSTKDNWIFFDRSEIFGNNEIIKVVIDGSKIDIGKRRGLITAESNGGTVKVDVVIEVVEKLGDINGDRKIDKYDLRYVENSFGFRIGENGYNEKADLNEDGIINVLDLMIIAKNLS